MKPLVLICSLDYELYLLLAYILNAEGFDSILAEGTEETLARMSLDGLVAVIIDCDIDAFPIRDFVTGVRAASNHQALPIAVFVGAGKQELYLEALKAGVNEIFMRPFNPERFLSYLGSLLPEKIFRPGFEKYSHNVLIYAGITMELDARRVDYKGHEVRLSPIEFRLLQQFMQRPEYVFSRDDLIQAAWPAGLFVEPRTVDVHVGRLRRALKSIIGRDIIRTVRGAGYALEDSDKIT
ncbi:winged helix-turn-helix transcriptional regulator [Rhizobium leucaenae]|uniref:Two-component system phosphate regulon response regulator PhoB n=1 Tax=Rhizobium leucaenae TaxID=29450 RepID=A0A7W6ZYP6_9HYPH|nr:response regulator transcription factor [Rhizobium leucaenae]MBB4571151.1 two-component system phosphate regulon response regulator PhoB [Rhizobium leucaenae]MBB6304116.1 two-component system phosphate regulon response regulator PhoB [Rhizobium leucaenae]